MAKTDLIHVYTGGTHNAFSFDSKFAGQDGIWAITHKLDEIFDILRVIDKESKTGTHFIKIENQPVWDYIHQNQENLTMEECQKLAQEHNFELEPGWFPGR